MRAFSCGHDGGPELRLAAADAPSDVLTLLAAPPDDAYAVSLPEGGPDLRLPARPRGRDDVLDAVPRLGGEASASDAVEAVGTWLTPMPGVTLGRGADRWNLPDPADRDVQGLLERRLHGLRDASRRHGIRANRRLGAQDGPPVARARAVRHRRGRPQPEP